MNDKEPTGRPEINEEGLSESNAARRLRLTGESTDSRLDLSDVPNDFKSKLINFWYHHKVKVLMTAFFAFALSVVIVQFASQSDPDLFLMYAGPDYLAPSDSSRFSDTMKELAEDYNGDGEVKIRITDIIFSTDAQMEAAKAEAAARGEEFTFDGMLNQNNSEKFTYEVFSDNAIICILAEDQYREVAAAKGFVPLRDIFGDTSVKGAIDEYGIRFSETDFYEFYASARIFPEDAVLAIRKLSTISAITGKSKAEKVHAYHVEVFRRMAAFEFPEGYVPE
ncbi:MAG: hypothetical protein E7638_08945 [Ruminococcaceae bacterium]|nr:hypothetical protein [Oscillospiraceae bacterium]